MAKKFRIGGDEDEIEASLYLDDGDICLALDGDIKFRLAATGKIMLYVEALADALGIEPDKVDVEHVP